jgi:hypothetical protein
VLCCALRVLVGKASIGRTGEVHVHAVACNAASGPWPLPAAAVDDSSGHVVPVQQSASVVPSRGEEEERVGGWWDAIYPSFLATPLVASGLLTLVGVEFLLRFSSSHPDLALGRQGRESKLPLLIDRERARRTRWPSGASRDDTKRSDILWSHGTERASPSIPYKQHPDEPRSTSRSPLFPKRSTNKSLQCDETEA